MTVVILVKIMLVLIALYWRFNHMKDLYVISLKEKTVELSGENGEKLKRSGKMNKQAIYDYIVSIIFYSTFAILIYLANFI